MKSCFVELAKRFPNSELIFDSITSKGIYYANKMLKEANMCNALFQWNLDSSKILESWSPHIHIINTLHYFKDIRKLPGIPLSLRVKMFMYDLLSKRGVIHLKFY